jgi:ADP-ribose pyrophosphatase YjhB (NUDIX family)
VVPSTTAVVTDDQDRIVLIRRRDNDLWALPGGGMELGESIVDTAVREVKEETGLDVEVTGLIGVYTNPHHVMAYTDGEVRQQFRCASPRDSSAATSSSTPKAPTSPGPIHKTFPR